MPDALISVILPVKNGMPFLKESIDSILNQTEPRFKLFVINDHSTDGSTDYVKSLKDERIILLENTGAGLVDALNLGLASAGTEFIARMDADDISHPERFEMQLKSFRENKNVVLVGTWYEYFANNPCYKSIAVKLPVDNKSIIRKMEKAENALCHPTVMIHKSVLDDIGYYDKGSFPAEDYDIFFRLIEKGELANIPMVLHKFRITQNSVFSRNAVQSSSKYSQIRNKYVSINGGKKKSPILTPYSMALYRKGLFFYLNGKIVKPLFYFTLSFILAPKRGFNFFFKNFIKK
ncbi:MAG: glycosyltransferase [Ignavibacteriaceae bacterium]